MTRRKMFKIVRSLGLSIEDDLGFTVCGGQLVNGERASPEVAAMNGWPVDEIAEEAVRLNLCPRNKTE